MGGEERAPRAEMLQETAEKQPEPLGWHFLQISITQHFYSTHCAPQVAEHNLHPGGVSQTAGVNPVSHFHNVHVSPGLLVM